MLAQIFEGSRDLRLSLNPVDRYLNNRIEALHAKTRAGHTGFSQGFGHLHRECARVDLNRYRSGFRECEAATQDFYQREELRWPDKVRRSAAKMHVTHEQRLGSLLCDQTDLLTQHR